VSGNAKKIAILVAVIVIGGIMIWWANKPTAEELAKRAHYAEIRANRGKPADDADKKSGAKESAEDDVQSQFAVAEEDIPSLLQNIKDVDFEYSLERVDRDPMSPLIGLQSESATTDQTQPQIGADQRLIQTARLKAVSGIVWDDQSPFAVIDDEVVTEGYAYPEGILLDEIHPDHVVFRVNDARVEVELKER
jgi:hypothetical protein